MARPTPTEIRPSLTQDTVFMTFLRERHADSRRDADRLQSEIDTLFAQIESKRTEQAEHQRIADACEAGLGTIDRALRPAPELTTRVTPEIGDETKTFTGA